MPDETPSDSPPPAPPAASAATSDSGTQFDIGEEFGTAKRNLPPAKIVVIGIVLIGVAAAIAAMLQRARPQGSGSIDNVMAVEVPDQNSVLVAINVTLQNSGNRTIWIHTIKATLKTDSGEFSDDPASAVDFERYFQAFPSLKEHAQPALLPEVKIRSGGEAHGTIIVSFPVTQDAFEKRKSLSVAIQPYDQPVPIVLSK
jgi:hypothetical protein